ncbi:MAG: hypothetical protein ABEK04_00400 [Candidatus Nanohalobium sp.]
MRKGQHLALESIATFGLTLVAAIGVVSMFNTVNKEIVDSTQETQAKVAANRVKTAMLQMSFLSEGERGYKQVNLPDKIGGSDYRVAVESSSVLVFTEDKNYRYEHNIARPSKEVRGAVEGGTVRIFKNQEGYILRGGR